MFKKVPVFLEIVDVGLKEKVLFCDQDENPIAVYDLDENGVFRCVRGLW